MHFRLFRRSPASSIPRTRHNGATASIPAQPHAASAPQVPQALEPAPFAGLYPYQPFTIDEIRAYVDRLRGEAHDQEIEARDLYDLSRRKLAKADDYERLLVLVAEDAARRAQVRPGPAMCTDELLAYRPHPEAQPQLVNGVQPGFEAQAWHSAHPYDCCPESARTGRSCAECSGEADTLTMPVVNGAAR